MPLLKIIFNSMSKSIKYNCVYIYIGEYYLSLQDEKPEYILGVVNTGGHWCTVVSNPLLVIMVI